MLRGEDHLGYFATGAREILAVDFCEGLVFIVGLEAAGRLCLMTVEQGEMCSKKIVNY